MSDYAARPDDEDEQEEENEAAEGFQRG